MIYFIRDSTGAIKIGYTSNNIKARLANLQTANSNPLTVLKVIEGTLEDEKEWHKKFEKDKIKGEWFKSTKELQKAIRYTDKFKRPQNADSIPIDLEDTWTEHLRYVCEVAEIHYKPNSPVLESNIMYMEGCFERYKWLRSFIDKHGYARLRQLKYNTRNIKDFEDYGILPDEYPTP